MVMNQSVEADYIASSCEDYLDRVRRNKHQFTAPEIIADARLKYINIGFDPDAFIATGHRTPLFMDDVPARYMAEARKSIDQMMEWIKENPNDRIYASFGRLAYTYFAALHAQEQLQLLYSDEPAEEEQPAKATRKPKSPPIADRIMPMMRQLQKEGPLTLEEICVGLDSTPDSSRNYVEHFVYTGELIAEGKGKNRTYRVAR